MKHRELRQLEQAIDDAIAFGVPLDPGQPARALIARHVCVLLSGYLECLVRISLVNYALIAKPKVELVNYISSSLDQFQNPAFDKIASLIGRFNAEWQRRLESIDESVKAAINSIVSNRHLIAHGRVSGISLAQVQSYYSLIKEFERVFVKICK